MTRNGRSSGGEIKDRERRHFGGEGLYVLSFLERDGTAFARFANRGVLKIWDRHLRFVRSEWVRGKRVLDAGCGNPRSVLFLSSLGAEMAAGCDVSFEVMRRGMSPRHAYALDKRMSNDAAPLFVADCESLPIKDSSLDSVFIFQALHHFDVGAFSAQAARALKPGGILFISDPNGAHPLRRAADAVGRAVKVMSRDERSISPRLLDEKLREAGFEIIETHAINFFSEIYFLLTAVVDSRAPALAGALRLGVIPLGWLDAALEKTVFALFPSLAWRRVTVARKAADERS